MKKVAVIGGGITGLTAAFQLNEVGLNPLLFESAAEVGGAIRTENRDGYQTEAGPNTLQDSPAEVSELIRALGLDEQVVEASPAAKNRYVLRDGVLVPVPLSPPALLRSPVLSRMGKLRLLKEPFISRPPAETEESLAAFTRRRLGREVLDQLVNPFVAGIYAGDPEKLSVQHAMPRLFALEREHGSLFRGMLAASKKRKAKGEPRSAPPRIISFPDGLAALPRELAARLRQKIYLETTVESVTAREGRWQVVASRYGRRLRDTYDAVVFALPPQALAKVRFQSEAGDDDQSLDLLKEIVQPPVASLSLGFDRQQIRHPLDGFGVLFPEREQRRTLGTLFPSTLFPGRAPEGQVLLTSFIGGARQPASAHASEDELVRMALADLRPILGIAGEPRFVISRLWPHAIPQYEVGYGRFLETIAAFEESHAGLFVAGPTRDGISLGQCIASGFLQAGRTERFLS